MTTSTGNNTSLSLPPDYFVRKEINQYVEKINFILTFVQTFICLSGLFGNILALIVINKKSLRNTSSALYITYMAIFDSTVLLLQTASLLQPRRNLLIHCSLTYLTDLFTFCANWVLIIITLERCVAVSSPFLAKRFCTVHSARYSVYVLLSVAIMLFSSAFPIIYHTDNYSPRKKCVIRQRFSLIHRTYQPIVLYGIPDLLLLSNFFTVFTLIRRRKQQSNDKQLDIRITDVHSNRKQQQLTVMLVTVNFAFYLFTTPALISYIAEYHSPPKTLPINKLKRFFLFSQITVPILQLHNATNFIFYCFTGQRFRQATIRTFNKYSNQFKLFYHQYILCDQNYTPITDYQMKNIKNTIIKNRIPYPSRTTI